MPELRNAIGQEVDTRNALLAFDILGVLIKRADPFGNAWIEMVDSEELRVHSRYSDRGQAYQITQTIRLGWEVTPIQTAE